MRHDQLFLATLLTLAAIPGATALGELVATPAFHLGWRAAAAAAAAIGL